MGHGGVCGQSWTMTKEEFERMEHPHDFSDRLTHLIPCCGGRSFCPTPKPPQLHHELQPPSLRRVQVLPPSISPQPRVLLNIDSNWNHIGHGGPLYLLERYGMQILPQSLFQRGTSQGIPRPVQRRTASLTNIVPRDMNAAVRPTGTLPHALLRALRFL